MARAFADEVRVIAEQYPESRSAVMPALRIAQERHGGWLPPEALEEVAEALDLTPAYCKGVATFYDMFHLEPVGLRLVDRRRDRRPPPAERLGGRRPADRPGAPR